jgi:hypothetical protein
MARVAVVSAEIEMPKIRIADHAVAPGGRYVADGNFSGEWFRNEVLVPALRETSKLGETLDIELDGTAGYGSSFLEEAFGGLVRECGFTASQLGGLLHIVALSPLYEPYKLLAERYIKAAKPKTVAA